MVSTREEAYALLDAARCELLAAIEGLTPEKMTVPMLGEWSVKDILAHVASWEEQILPDLRRIRDGHRPALASFREQDVDQWNALIMSLRKNFPLEQVLHELDYYRRTTKEALDFLPDAAFASGFVPATCAISVHHDREHAGQIRAWRQREDM